MEDKKIKAVKQWPELKSIKNIQVFLDLPIFIGNLSKVLIKLLHHLPQC